MPRRSRSRSYSPRRPRERDDYRPARRESGREPPNQTSLLVRNLSKSTRGDDLKYLAEKYGQVRDVYLPKDFYSGEPRGIGFVEFTSNRDAADAKYGMDRLMFDGRELSVVFALQGRKKPDEFQGSGGGGGGGRYGGGGGGGGSYRGRDRSYSPRRRSRTRSRSRSRIRSGSRSPRRSPVRSRSPKREDAGRSPSRSPKREDDRSPLPDNEPLKGSP